MKRFIIFLFIWLLTLPTQAQSKGEVVFIINTNDTMQVIRNIGASGCWFSEEIGKDWPAAEKEQIAKLLFSKTVDAAGKPQGIGLSAFRFNIGAGTAEQGDSSGIKEPSHRVECFLSPGGHYDFTKQGGYRWMLQQARNYGVENLIAFVNSPPVQFTKNGLGFKLNKEERSNLSETKYRDYAAFLATVLQHFEKTGLPFNYISPVNEPQWDWSGTFGEAKQEGSPWTNEEIYAAATALDSSLGQHRLQTKILLPEAATLTHLYAGDGKAARQIALFWDSASPLHTGGLRHVAPYVQGHGYFTDNGGQLVGTRLRLRDTIAKYNGLEYWQSEYCMLGDGYQELTKGGRSAMDCALFLAKVIHTDFTVGNATAWHYWNAYEPGRADSNTRYYLIALNPDRHKDTANRFTVTKNLWALGHYSLFIRPGMRRIEIRNDGVKDSLPAQHVLLSAFRDAPAKTIVVNAINYTTEDKHTTLAVQAAASKPLQLQKRYVTSAKSGDDLKPYPVATLKKNGDRTTVLLPARSISTFIFSE